MSAPSKDRDQPGHLPSLIRVFPVHSMGIAKDPSFLHADSKGSDQTGQTPRLIRVFAGRTAILLVLSCHGSTVHLRLYSGINLLYIKLLNLPSCFICSDYLKNIKNSDIKKNFSNYAKFGQCCFTLAADGLANSVDPEQQSDLSDLDLCCLPQTCLYHYCILFNLPFCFICSSLQLECDCVCIRSRTVRDRILKFNIQNVYEKREMCLKYMDAPASRLE